MTNKEIAAKFNLLGKLMDLHGENPFKIRSYSSAYLNIRKWPDPLINMDDQALSEIQGIGKAIQQKIIELRDTGEMQALNKYLESTPSGIVELIQIKGLGAKKLRLIWEDLGIESPGELLYAIHENRLIDLKGFGQKTQEQLKQQLEYHFESQNKFRYADIEKIAEQLIQAIHDRYPNEKHDLTGKLARKCNTLESIDLITTLKENELATWIEQSEDWQNEEGQNQYQSVPVNLLFSNTKNYVYDLAKSQSDEAFWNELNIAEAPYADAEALFASKNLPVYIPEFREAFNQDKRSFYQANNLLSLADIKGCIHNHSTYSDGMNTLEEMVEAAAEKAYEYFVITDHSKSAFYANGLEVERLYKQMDEVAKLDQQNQDIRIFSGIESDILSDGSLDYSDEVLGELDLIIASVHSNLKMDEQKATQRILKAVENPYTSILGHPTGRLLLSRKGYPLDHARIIDACADYGVAIELNANPYRLDLDWKWIYYACQKDVLISINPDAHQINGMDDMQYGVHSARKAGLPISHCLNAMDIDDFEEWLEDQHSKRS